MSAADVRLMRREDPGPLFPEVAAAGFLHILPDSAWKVAIIEEGMASGKPSVSLALPTPDGRPEAYVIVETSLEILVTIMAAARALVPEFFAGGVFDGSDREAMALQMAEAFVTVAQGLQSLNPGTPPRDIAHMLLQAMNVR